MQNQNAEQVRCDCWDTYEAAIDAGERMFRIQNGLDFSPESTAEEVRESWLGADPEAAESSDFYKAAKFVRDFYLEGRDLNSEYWLEMKAMGAKLDYVPYGDWHFITGDTGGAAVIMIDPCEGGNEENGENWHLAEFHTIR